MFAAKAAGFSSAKKRSKVKTVGQVGIPAQLLSKLGKKELKSLQG